MMGAPDIAGGGPDITEIDRGATIVGGDDGGGGAGRWGLEHSAGEERSASDFGHLERQTRHAAMSDPTDQPPKDPLKDDPHAIANHRPYHRLVRRLLRFRGVPDRDIEDVHQDLFIAMIDCLPSVRPVRSMEALLARTSFRLAATYLRKQRVRGPIMEYGDDGPAGPSSPGIPAPEAANILKERTLALDKILGRMDPSCARSSS
jgi:hypothetical protein